jgi:hypothetical protein
VACVEWGTTGTTNVYRIGHKGKVDLKYLQEGDGGYYYRDHLIVLGQDAATATATPSTLTTTTPTTTIPPSTSSSLVVESLNSNQIQSTNQKLSELISISDASPSSLSSSANGPDATDCPQNNLNINGDNNNSNNNNNITEAKATNTTTTMTTNSNVTGTNNMNSTKSSNSAPPQETFNNLFSVGDKVKVDVSLEAFKQMQEGHGGWNFKMADVYTFFL